MLNADIALAKILKSAKPLASERVKLRNALGRTLAEDIIAAEKVPPFDNSSMDGFAVVASDLADASSRRPVTLTMVGEASAGNVFGRKLHRGEAVQIMTGGKIPAGADSVVPIERAKVLEEKKVQFIDQVKKGANIRHAGEDIKKNATALKKGGLLTPARLAIPASLGFSKVWVYRRPVVNILATGDELVRVRATPRDGQIRNSTSCVLLGYVREAGGEANVLGIVRDKKKRLRKAIRAGLDGDMLLVTGGVSVGKYDLVKDVLEEVGVRIVFWRVNIKPGKPLVFGTFKKTLVFGLPGNPVSTGVTFLEFVRPALQAMLGQSSTSQLRVPAILDEAIKKKDGKKHFIRGIATVSNGSLHVSTTGSQSSGVMSSLAKANCFIIVPESVEVLRKGSRVEVELIQ